MKLALILSLTCLIFSHHSYSLIALDVIDVNSTRKSEKTEKTEKSSMHNVWWYGVAGLAILTAGTYASGCKICAAISGATTLYTLSEEVANIENWKTKVYQKMPYLKKHPQVLEQILVELAYRIEHHQNIDSGIRLDSNELAHIIDLYQNPDNPLSNKEIEQLREVFKINGATGTIRTYDLLIRSQVLYPAKLRLRTKGIA